MCTSSVDSHRLPFTCALADGQPLSAALASATPSRPRPRRASSSQLSFPDVAVGTMLVAGAMRERVGGGRARLERELLMRARATWIRQAPGLRLLVLVSCGERLSHEGGERADGSLMPPSWFSGVPNCHWRCYRGRDRLGQSLWRKTSALLSSLLRVFPTQAFYLKIDSDTMLFPRSLMLFLRALHSLPTPRRGPGPGAGVYFGSNRISQRRLFCDGERCLFNSARWRELDARIADNRTTPLATVRRGRRSRGLANAAAPHDGFAGGRGHAGDKSGCELHAGASYAQGGAYGFDRRALSAFMDGSGCMESVAAAAASHMHAEDLFEDEAVGLCMHLHGVRLLTCGCFYDWGPCDIFNPVRSCAPDTNASKICHLPLSVHKLRKIEWYDGWWRFLSAREPAALAAFGRWEAGQAGVLSNWASPT
jgi:hypothetical protein